MSKIGKQPVKLPKEVDFKVVGGLIKITGPKGSLERKLPREILVEEKNGEIVVKRKKENKKAKSLHGTIRAHIANMIQGVTKGWLKELELVGTGYRAELKGKDLILTVGYSHPVEIRAPEDINFKVERTSIAVEGIDKEKVGEIAARIRAVRPPEPYKGKGIRYKDEVVRRKPGKAAKTVGAV
jgi:large subunit ribosomal protein L6